MSQPKLAIFDLDYTLTRKGTWGRFTWQMIKKRIYFLPFLLISAGLAQAIYKLKLIKRVRVKQVMMFWCMWGRSKAVMIAEAKAFAEAEVPDKLRPVGMEVLKDHQSNGDDVIIVSAAVDIIVKAISDRLGVKHFLATDMSWTADQKLRLSFASANCYGSEKVSRFESFLSQHPEFEGMDMIMYSDSHSDLPLMQYCNESVAVNPNKKLRHIAENSNIPVVDWG